MRVLVSGAIAAHADVIRALLPSPSEIVMVEDPRDEAAILACSPVDLVLQDIRHEGEAAESLHRATLGTWMLAKHSGARAFVQLSTMAMFDSYDRGWAVTESWLPRPTDDPAQLNPYLGELAARELARVGPRAVTLRLWSPAGAIDRAEEPAVGAAIDRVLAPAAGDPGWSAVHAAAAPGLADLPTAPARPARPGPVRDLPRPERLAMLGAGGPLGAAVVAAVGTSIPMLLADRSPLAERAGAAPQSAGAPLPQPASPPHAERVVDVTSHAEVTDLAGEVDCLVNCAVVRHDVQGAFAVNVLGAHAVMRAAVASGHRRVVHTGPAMILGPHPFGHHDDRVVGPATPARAGDDLYLLTKLIAMNLCRVVAEHHGIACPIVQFVQLVDPEVGRPDEVHPFVISWADAGRAVHAAATVRELPEPAPVLHIHVDSPHDRYHADHTWEILGIRPQDGLEHLWHRHGRVRSVRSADE